MSRVHFVGGEKGGVGKSVLARLLCEWFSDREVGWSAFDADPAQGKLMSWYGAAACAVELSTFRSTDPIMELALAGRREVVVDLPAKSWGQLLRWVEASDVFGLAEESGLELVFWYVTDGGFQSMSGIERMVQDLPASARVVIVRNRRWAPGVAASESTLLGGEVARSGCFIDLPALDPALMYEVEARKAPFGQLLTESASEPRALSPMKRQRLARWLAEVRAELQLAALVEAPEAQRAAPLDAVVQEASRSVEEASSSHEEASPDVEEASLKPRRPIPAAGSSWCSGPHTWTEVGDGYQIHHVRYP